MHSTGVFFGGLAVGGILAAACGFDLFPEERGERRALEGARTELREVKSVLVRTQEISRREAARAAELEAQVAALRERGAGHAALEQTHVRQTAEADLLRRESARLGAELRAALAAALAAQAESRRLRRDVLEQIIDFFALERGPHDAALVSRFLATDAAKEEKQALVLELIKRNKEVLLALPHGTGPGEAAIEPAAAREPGGLGGIAPGAAVEPAGRRGEGR
jgi:hypothetical protein